MAAPGEAQHRSLDGSADSDVPPLQILTDPEHGTAWAFDRSKTTTETSKRHLRQLDEKIDKHGPE